MVVWGVLDQMVMVGMRIMACAAMGHSSLTTLGEKTLRVEGSG